ncbi:MAG TPA: SMC-Scp complex subunit ScpB [Candidatus Binatia bacterium]|nr:SMC-Scp complex subunit ScpB [Candidatus Binatia bacterium]
MDDLAVGSNETDHIDEIEEVGDAASFDDAAGLPRLESIIESVLFAAGTPIGLRRLVQLLDGPTSKEVTAAIARLQQQYDGSGRGLRLVEVAGGYQFRTAPENADWVRALLREKPARIGRATLETLAIIAYKQPVTRAEIEAIRGVDVEGALTSLLSKRLIKIAGRRDTVGRPLLYVTTPEFLEVFGLKDLNDLPMLKELPSGESSNDPDAPSLAAETGEPPLDTGSVAEAAESGGRELAAGGGATDPRGEDSDQRPGGDGTGDQGGSADGSDHR